MPFFLTQSADTTCDDDAFAGCSQEEDWMRSYVETDLRYIPSLQGMQTGMCLTDRKQTKCCSIL